jgi:hypothetical protein
VDAAPRLCDNSDSNRYIVTQGPTTVPAAAARARCAIGLLAFPMAKTPGLLVRPCSSALAKSSPSTSQREAARSDAGFNRVAIHDERVILVNKPGHFIAHNFNSEQTQSLSAARIE